MTSFEAPKLGITQADHDSMNSYEFNDLDIEEKRKRYAELRELYADDKLALEQIDSLDGETEYHDKMGLLREAFLNKDFDKVRKLDQWFLEHYPLTTKSK